MLIDNADLPKKLYRFRSNETSYFFDELENSLLRKRIFLSSAAFLNDPYDFSPVVEESPIKDTVSHVKGRKKKGIISRERYSELAGRKVTRAEFRRQERKFRNPVTAAKVESALTQRMFAEHRSMSKVACFSEILHNNPMWAHYANNHQGVCVEFDVNWQLDDETSYFPLKVLYSSSRPQLCTLELLEYMERSESPDVATMETMEKLCLTKAEDWAYEREWRLVDHYNGPASYVTVPALSPARLVFGVNADPSVVDRVYDQFGSRVEICRAVLSESAFDFSTVPL